jgi:hypothetical protein
MNVVRGRVRDGHVETDSAFPDGAEVVVVLGETEPFDLAESDVAELMARVAAADRGEVGQRRPFSRGCLLLDDHGARRRLPVSRRSGVRKSARRTS